MRLRGLKFTKFPCYFPVLTNLDQRQVRSSLNPPPLNLLILLDKEQFWSVCDLSPTCPGLTSIAHPGRGLRDHFGAGSGHLPAAKSLTQFLVVRVQAVERQTCRLLQRENTAPTSEQRGVFSDWCVGSGETELCKLPGPFSFEFTVAE